MTDEEIMEKLRTIVSIGDPKKNTQDMKNWARGFWHSFHCYRCGIGTRGCY